MVMFEILDMVHTILEEQKITAEEQLQLNKICDLEDKFVKGFSKDKWKEYFDLDIEKSCLSGMQTDKAIIVTYELCKKLFQK
jgi:hypothetical protein